MNYLIDCKVCNKPLEGRQTVFCSKACKDRTDQSYRCQQARGLKRKLLLVQQSGGCCSSCGYKKNLSVLTFHHQNPEKKSFELDLRSLSNRKQDKIDAEVKKCILLCQNCHGELHNPQHSLEVLAA